MTVKRRDIKAGLDLLGSVSKIMFLIGALAFWALSALVGEKKGVRQGREEACASVCEAGSQGTWDTVTERCICTLRTETVTRPALQESLDEPR